MSEQTIGEELAAKLEDKRCLNGGAVDQTEYIIDEALKGRIIPPEWMAVLPALIRLVAAQDGRGIRMSQEQYRAFADQIEAANKAPEHAE